MADWKDRQIDALVDAQFCSCEWPNPIHSRLHGWRCNRCGKGCPPSQRDRSVFDGPPAIAAARADLKAHKDTMSEIQGEILPHCPAITPLQIGRVLDALWLCGYVIKKEG